MTTVRFFRTKPTPEGESLPVGGTLRFTPTRKRVVEHVEGPAETILPIGFTAQVPSDTGRLDVDLAPTEPGWVWEIYSYGFGVTSTFEYVIVPDQTEPIDEDKLVRVSKDTLDPEREPDPAWWAELESAKALGSQVQQAKTHAVVAASDAGAARDQAQSAQAAAQQAAEEAKLAGEAAAPVWENIREKPETYTPDDQQTANLIDQESTLTRAALDVTVSKAVEPLNLSMGQISPRAMMRKGDSPQILSLITGTEDESLGTSGCTVSADTVNFRLGSRGWKMSVPGAATNAYALLSPIPPSKAGPVSIRPAQAVCLWVFVEDASKVVNIQVEITQDSNNTVGWLRSNTASPAQVLVNGWNLLRWKMAEGLPTSFTGETANRVRVFMSANAATSITIGHLYLETPPKARLIFVADRGYRSFVVRGLPALRAAGVPVTWALDIQKLGDHAGQFPDGPKGYAESITESEVAQFAQEGDSISFHGFSAEPTAEMTPAQIRSDTVQSLKWLQARGYRGRMWRAAWVQNQAANHTAAEPYLLGQATWDVTTHSVALDCWPPRDIQNIARWDFYAGKTEELIDRQFDILKRTHSLMVVYNHGVGTGYFSDATQAQFDRFMWNVKQGIDEGWLEPTTFEALFVESGGTFETLGGATVATFTDREGNRVTKSVL